MDLHLSAIDNIHVVGRSSVVPINVEISPKIGPEFADSREHGRNDIAIHTNQVIQRIWIDKTGY